MERLIVNEDGDVRVAESYIFKILIVGEVGVGKTSFVRRYVQDQYTDNYKATIGVDFATKSIKWSEGCQVELFMCDLAGQERIRTQIQGYFRETHGVIYVYDLERTGTDNNIEGWKVLLDEKCTLKNEPYKPPSILLLNKIDLVGSADLSGLDALAKSQGMIGAYPMSAKTGQGIDTAMKVFISQLLRVQRLATKDLPDIQDQDRVQLGLKKTPAESGCC